MVGMDRSSKAVVAPRSGAAISSHRLLMAFLVVTVFIAAIVSVVAAATMGHGTAALVIALVAGGSFLAAAFC